MTVNHFTQMAIKYIMQAEAIMDNANKTKAIMNSLGAESHEIAASTVDQQNKLVVQALKKAEECLREAEKILDPEGKIEADDGNFS